MKKLFILGLVALLLLGCAQAPEGDTSAKEVPTGEQPTGENGATQPADEEKPPAEEQQGV